ncbi:MAG TPA: hypothetical protein VMU94_14010 [Streptosporangiaceae bacterium]|nr:hypothetical protein [Streptosporangiaceae bacterium]
MAEIPDDPVTVDDDAAGRLWAIADELSVAGLAVRLRRTRGVLGLTATMRQPGHCETDVSVDEDGYTELRYWADPAAAPAEAAYAITNALAAITPSLARSAPGLSRPRETSAADTGLRQRMERLAPGHPSSPYNSDGSRKPPVPDPFSGELPIPGDPGFRPEGSDPRVG